MTIFNLTECFRCGTAIVNAANRSIERNHEPHTVPIRSATGRDGMVDVEVCELEVSARCVQIALCNYKPEDIAVLGRNRRLLRAFGHELDALHIKSYVVGDGFDAWSGDAFRQMYAALRLSVNPNDNLAFLTIARAMGMSASHIAHIRLRAANAGASFAATAWPEDLMHAVLTGDGSVESVASVVWGENVDADRADAIRWWTEICALGVPHGLEWFATREPQDDTPPVGAVTLSTIHSAKGLEWPVVFVIGCNEGVLPSRMAIKSDEVPEERRCFYVAVTRARERLALHARPSEHNEQSRFLIEAMGGAAEDARPVIARTQ